MAEAAPAYRFAGFTLDVGRGTLLGPEGELRLRPKSFELLVYLARHPGRLVGREELLNAVWGHAAVTDDSITQCLVEIRRALSDESRTLVRTMPRRGYLFDVSVETLDEGASPPIGKEASHRAPLARPGAVAAIAVVALLAGLAWWASVSQIPEPAGGGPGFEALPNSIAVLPFVDMSAEGDQAYFGDGIAEEILNLLAQVRELKVIARTSSFSFKQQQQLDIKRIGAQLGVAHVLEGSVRKSGNRVRVTAQLVDASDGAHLWSQAFDRELVDIFAVQSEIAGSVAEVLKATLLGRLHKTAPDVRAYEYFLRGRFLFHRRAPGDVVLARRHFQTALDLEPDYAAAWASLAGTYIVEVGEGTLAAELGLEPGRLAAERALEIDAALPEAHIRAATAYAMSGDVVRARKHLEVAESLDPDNALLLGILGGGALARGNLATAVEFKRRAVAVDPLSVVNRRNYASVLRAAGRLEEAHVQLLALREISPERSDEFEADRVELLLLQGRHDEALAALRHLDQDHQRDALLSMALHGLGRERESRAVIARLSTGASYAAASALAEVHAYSGRPELAWHWLEESRVRIQGEIASAEWRWRQLACASAFLQPLKDDPRWAALFQPEP